MMGGRTKGRRDEAEAEDIEDDDGDGDGHCDRCAFYPVCTRLRMQLNQALPSLLCHPRRPQASRPVWWGSPFCGAMRRVYLHPLQCGWRHGTSPGVGSGKVPLKSALLPLAATPPPCLPHNRNSYDKNKKKKKTRKSHKQSNKKRGTERGEARRCRAAEMSTICNSHEILWGFCGLKGTRWWGSEVAVERWGSGAVIMQHRSRSRTKNAWKTHKKL